MIKLTRSISVTSFDAAATVAVGRNRPESLAVAQLASDLNRPIGVDDVIRELLGPLPPLFSKRVIEHCVSLGLLDKCEDDTAMLSEAGRIALEHGEILVPEEGIWRFFVVDDPLVPAALIHAQRLVTESVRNERKAGSSGAPRQYAERPTSLLEDCCGELPCTSVQDGHLIQLIELADRGASGPQSQLRLELLWEEQDEHPSVRLIGHLPSERKLIDAVIELPEAINEFAYISLWGSLVGQAEGIEFDVLTRWYKETARPVAPIPFRDLDETERRAFHCDIHVPNCGFEQFGYFDPTDLKHVELVPSSENDAQEWLNWLEWDGINDYVTPDLLKGKSLELRSKFPHYKPRAQSPQELLKIALAAKDDDRSRFLLAPSDLGLWS